MYSTVGKEKTQMNKKTLFIITGVAGIILVGLVVAVLCTGGFTSPF